MEETNKKERDEDLIKNYINDDYTQEDAQKVLDIIKKGEQNPVLDKYMEDVWEESENSAKTTDSKKAMLSEEAYLFLRKEKQKYIIIPRSYIYRGLSLFACITIILAIGIGVYNHSIPFSSDKKLTIVEYFTSYAETKSITLPDGTKVTLNACSSISFPEKFANNERNIRLDGEAFFQVAKNEKQPFIIATTRFNVKVLGTEFNVRAYKDDIIQSVNVEGGKVQVDMPEAIIRLVASEQIDMNSKTEEYIKYSEPQTVAVWREGNLRFNKTPIKDVANELERIYEINISFERGQPFDNLITGELSNTDLKSVLKSLELTSNIRFKYDEERKEVYLYR